MRNRIVVVLGVLLVSLLLAAPGFGALTPECQAALAGVGDVAGAIPAHIIELCGGTGNNNAPAAPEDNAFGWESVADDVAGMVLNTPDVLSFAGATNPTGGFIGACDFTDDLSVLYCADSNATPTLYTTDVATGAVTVIGTGTIAGGETPSSLDWDATTGTMYALTTNISAGSLYTVDIATGATTLVGATSSPCPIGGGFDAAGNGFYYDICDDSFYSFDKATGASTLIGPLGFDANFGQGMDFDADDDTCYLFAFNLGAFQGELRTCDTATGATALVGVIGGTTPGGLNQIGGGGVQTVGIPPNPLEVPTVNVVGLVALALLLVLGAALVMRRRIA